MKNYKIYQLSHTYILNYNIKMKNIFKKLDSFFNYILILELIIFQN